MIVSGKGKTETVRAMPGYSGRKHSDYITVYETLYSAVRLQEG
jgi:hypothetical protein